ncbi:MAG: hypothetical protein HN472_10075 [Nitrospina sp.]|jgi:hypothetical protein|nr:hypothetical protein [Nitrospina sp.]MBT6596052.1 hypothetical protein [Nitrospina sp.]
MKRKVPSCELLILHWCVFNDIVGDVMGRLPKEKVALSIYVTPKCKEKLDCLQKLYAIGDRKFSLSQIVEEAIHSIYNTAYLCQDSSIWKVFFKTAQFIETSEATNKGMDEVLSIVQNKKAASKEVLNVPVSIKDNAKKEFKEWLRKFK